MRSIVLALLLLVGLAGCATEPGRDFPVFFPNDEMTLTPDAAAVVASVARQARQAASAHLIVTGQAGGGGPHEAELARQRGETVVEALTRAGVESRRIELRPGAPGPDEHGVMARKVVISLIP